MRSFFLTLVLPSLFMPGNASAASSREDLVSKMLASLTEEVPAEVQSVGFWKLENLCGAPIDIDLLREDLEIRLVQAHRFQFVNREVLDEALREMELCNDVSCLVDPKTMQRFGRARGIDAFIYGEVIDASANYPELSGKDYFVTVLLKAISAKTSSILWEKKVTGVNLENVLERIGALPIEEAFWREEGLGRAIAAFFEESEPVRSAGIRTIALWKLEKRSGVELDMDQTYRAVSSALVERTRFALVDRRNLELLLEEKQLILDEIVDQSERASLAKLFGIDGFLYGRIREVADQSITCAIRLNQVETNVDVDAEILTGREFHPERKLVNLLRSAGPSSFDSDPPGAAVVLDGKQIGTTPMQRQLGNGEYSVKFSLQGYADTTLAVPVRYGGGKRIFARLHKIPALLAIVSEPPGASVSIDGEAIEGTTPLASVASTLGKHTFSLRKEDFFPLDVERVVRAREAELRFELVSKLGILEVASGGMKGATIRLNGKETGEATPARFERLGPGRYEVVVEKCGCEGARGRIDVAASRITSIDLPLVRKERKGAATRSLFLPGLGQFYKGAGGRGTLFLIAAVGAGGFAYLSHSAREGAIDDYNEAKARYDAALTQSEIDAAYATMEEKYEEIGDKENLRNYGVYALAGVWVWNVVDAALGWPLDCGKMKVGFERRVDGRSAVVLSRPFGGGWGDE